MGFSKYEEPAVLNVEMNQNKRQVFLEYEDCRLYYFSYAQI
ncbi:hypothetical protein NXH76_01505 [Blautia schinkii]|nr:hypothetical protein [Blautia schinkii]